jgi:hypothetical protein
MPHKAISLIRLVDLFQRCSYKTGVLVWMPTCKGWWHCPSVHPSYLSSVDSWFLCAIFSFLRPIFIEIIFSTMLFVATYKQLNTLKDHGKFMHFIFFTLFIARSVLRKESLNSNRSSNINKMNKNLSSVIVRVIDIGWNCWPSLFKLCFHNNVVFLYECQLVKGDDIVHLSIHPTCLLLTADFFVPHIAISLIRLVDLFQRCSYKTGTTVSQSNFMKQLWNCYPLT